MFRAVAYTVAGSCIILCLIDPVLNIDLGRSSLSLSITRFLSILMFVPFVDMGLNSYSLCSSLWAWHCIQVGAIMEVFLIFDSFLLFSYASLLFMVSGSTVIHPLIFDTTVIVSLFFVAASFATSILFAGLSRCLRCISGRTCL